MIPSVTVVSNPRGLPNYNNLFSVLRLIIDSKPGRRKLGSSKFKNSQITLIIKG